MITLFFKKILWYFIMIFFDAVFWLFDDIFWSYDLMVFFDAKICILLALQHCAPKVRSHYCRGTCHRISTIIRSIIKKNWNEKSKWCLKDFVLLIQMNLDLRNCDLRKNLEKETLFQQHFSTPFQLYSIDRKEKK